MKPDGTYPAGASRLSIPLQPKAIHDEMNASSFDEYGRMTANLGVEAVPATPGAQNVVLYPYTFPGSEVIDGTNLPRGDVNVTPIASESDGTQIWKITHNGVDTHPIHFHLYDVQVVNRVTWDNIIIPPDASELGWKDTVRISPLEDTIVALRPVIPSLPWEIPNSIRQLHPMMPAGALLGDAFAADVTGAPMTTFAPNGEPIRIENHLVNFGWEYVWHCHILSHEEMDMMRPEAVALPPNAPSGLAVDLASGTVSWTDNSIAETAYLVQKKVGTGDWTTLHTVTTDLSQPNATGAMSYTDATVKPGDQYRVVAQNTVGDTADYSNPGNEITPGTYAFPVVTATSTSSVVTVPTA
jgi:hypothetical protein